MSESAMQSVELSFCELCGVSIPQKDLDTGIARRVAGKAVGACCLTGLVAGTAASGAGDEAPAASSREPSLVLPVAVLLLALVAGLWYVDWRAQSRVGGSSERQSTILGELRGLEEWQKGVDASLADLPAVAARVAVAEQGPALERLEKGMDWVQAKIQALPTLPAAGFTELRSQVVDFGRRITDLAERQRAIESLVSRSLGEVRDGLAKVGSDLVDLRRRGLPSVAGKQSPGGPGPKPKLPAALARKIDDLASSDAGTRWAAIDELVRSGDERVVAYILPMLADEDPYIRRLCAQGLARFAGAGSSVLDALVAALEDKEGIVRDAAYRSLLKVSGQRFTFDPEGSEAKRKGWVKKWSEWVAKQASK